MKKEELYNKISTLSSKSDFVSLINEIHINELSKMGFQDRFFEISPDIINYYCNPKNKNRYYEFEIQKKSGGKRIINAPNKYNHYKLILQYINEILKALYTPSKYANGFAVGKSVVDNAKNHIGRNYVFNIDLKDFFTSIDQARVWKRLQLNPFKFSVPIASVIAGLCAIEYSDNGIQRNVLPQGAPTSPILTNAVCDVLDRKLGKLAHKYKVTYSRYADDITFSSNHNVYRENSEFRIELKAIIESQHFTINDNKTRLQKKGGKQEVTGLIISNKINVSQKYVRDIRNILYIWEKYGFEQANLKFIPKYNREKGYIKKCPPNMTNVLKGKLLYLKMVKGDNDSVYRRLSEKFEILNFNQELDAMINTNILYTDAIDKIKKLSKTNNEFKQGLEELFKYHNTIDCKEIILKQAQDIYNDIPFSMNIKNRLVEDFCEMQYCKITDDFKGFCYYLNKQIKIMTDEICTYNFCNNIVLAMRDCSLYVKTFDKDDRWPITPSISIRENTKMRIGSFLSKSSFDKSLSPIDKMKSVVYFLGYKAMMKYSDYDNFCEISNLLYSIYQCRNLDTRNGRSELAQATIDKVLAKRTLFQYKFENVLIQYTEFIKEGYSFLPIIRKYADDISFEF